jgi:hypothetical protein
VDGPIIVECDIENQSCGTMTINGTGITKVKLALIITKLYIRAVCKIKLESQQRWLTAALSTRWDDISAFVTPIFVILRQSATSSSKLLVLQRLFYLNEPDFFNKRVFLLLNLKYANKQQ